MGFDAINAFRQVWKMAKRLDRQVPFHLRPPQGSGQTSACVKPLLIAVSPTSALGQQQTFLMLRSMSAFGLKAASFSLRRARL
jgi:hypothetical protein